MTSIVSQSCAEPCMTLEQGKWGKGQVAYGGMPAGHACQPDTGCQLKQAMSVK